MNLRRTAIFGSVLVPLLVLPLEAWAHKPSDSYLSLRLDGEDLVGQWDIALRDLEHALGLDADNDDAITWGELRARHPVIAAYALSHLSARAGDQDCSTRPTEHLVDHHSDGAYAVLRFRIDCPNTAAALSLEYRLFFDLDPTHRGLLRVVEPDGVRTAVFSPQQPHITLTPGERGSWRQFSEYWREGVWHIWIGFDHILFLVALLLPAVLWWQDGRWQAVEVFRPALMAAVGIVTAFTLAHSITLSIAAFGWVALPYRWVESAIAGTVVLAALNNLYPFVQMRRWLMAFSLGLVHGFGFASVLSDLSLPGATFALALAGFNLGVEAGQLAVVAAFLPIGYLLRGSWFYRQAVMRLGSLTVAVTASIWLLECGLDWNLLPDY